MKLGLDIDDVLADFDHALISFARVIGRSEVMPASPNAITTYDWFPKVGDGSDVWNRAKETEWFWAGINPIYSTLGQLQPACYITARPKWTQTVTEHWLWKHQLPYAPVFTTDKPGDKLEIAQAFGLTHFIDDRVETVKTFQKAGIKAYLHTQPHNRRSQVTPRLNSLKGLINGTVRLGEGINV